MSGDRKPGAMFEDVYALDGPEAARAYYDRWAEAYDDEVASADYRTPGRVADALAAHAADPAAPLVDLGCGTGLSGAALARRGFATIDGFDLSPAMLDRARALGVYRALDVCDLSRGLPMAPGDYANAAAVGVVNADLMPVTVLEGVLDALRPGGAFAFSLNGHVLADGRVEAHVMELTDSGHAEVLFREEGDHLPGIGLSATVYVLRRR